MNNNGFELSMAAIYALFWITAGLMVVFGFFAPYYIYRCHRNLSRLVTLQEETNKLLRAGSRPQSLPAVRPSASVKG